MRRKAGKGVSSLHFKQILPMISLADEQAAHEATQAERERTRLSELSQHLVPGETKVVCRSQTIRVQGTYKGLSPSNRLEVIDDDTHVVFSFRPTELHL